MAKHKKVKKARFSLARTTVAGVNMKLLPPLVVGLFLFGAGVHLSLQASAQTARPVATNTLQTAPTPTPAPSPTPAPAKPSLPPPTPKPAPVVPSPAPPATPSQQAVASSGTAPGKPAGGLTANPTPSPAPTPSPTPSPTPAPPAGATGSSSSPLPDATARYNSTNWAGYFMNTVNYTSISGSWTATSPTKSGGSTSADATWIGIGGASTNDLIQVGTENIVSSNGTVSTSVFYELLPASPVYPTAVTVTPGDVLSASITETSSGQWTITLTDSTTRQTFTTSVSYASSHSSAEWIQEDPSYASGGLVPFDNFGTVYFTGSAAAAGGINYNLTSGNANAVVMVDGAGKPTAAPSVTGSDNTSFDVARE